MQSTQPHKDMYARVYIFIRTYQTVEHRRINMLVKIVWNPLLCPLNAMEIRYILWKRLGMNKGSCKYAQLYNI